MNRTYLLYVLPVIATFIGWLTNYIAVRMLFRPRQPINVFGYTLQGVFPKRQKDLAKRISEIIATEFLSSSDLQTSFDKYLQSEELHVLVEAKLKEVISKKIAQFMPIFPAASIDSMVEKILVSCRDDLDILFKEVAKRLASSEATPNVQLLIEERIANFSVEKLEELCKAVLHKEFKFIEIIGGVLGFIIGVIQMLIAYFA